MTQYLFIANPVSGGGRYRKKQTKLQKWMGQELPEATWVSTEYPGHAIKLAADGARRGVQAIISVGGDGTLHEVVQGIAPIEAGRRPSVGVLPSGSGADYARRLRELHGDPGDWAWLKHPKRVKVDLGLASFRDGHSRAKKRYFLNIADAGLGGETVRQMSRGGFGWGPLKYLIAALRAAWSYRPPMVRLAGFVGSGKAPPEAFPLLLAVVAKGRYFGGGMCIAPQAQLSNGKFQVILASRMSYGRLLRQIPAIYRKRRIRQPQVYYGSATRLSLAVEEGSLPLDLDGEFIEVKEVEFEIFSQALKILVPPAGRRSG